MKAMKKIKEVAAYCAANIEDWDLKVDLALRHIGRKMPIDYGFRSEIEDAASEWAEENGCDVDVDAEEIVLCSD